MLVYSAPTQMVTNGYLLTLCISLWFWVRIVYTYLDTCVHFIIDIVNVLKTELTTISKEWHVSIQLQ